MNEECFLVEGDVWIGSSGLMKPGSYFWRPPFTTHGPFSTKGGFMAISWVDSPVVNHFHDDPFRTAAENRREAALERSEKVLMSDGARFG